MSINLLDQKLEDFGIRKAGCELEYRSGIGPNELRNRLGTDGLVNDCVIIDLAKLGNGKGWLLDASHPMFDRSISVRYPYTSKLEIVSHPLSISLLGNWIVEASLACNNFTSVGKSCGLHFHFGTNRLSATDKAKIVALTGILEPFLYSLTKMDRHNLKYCLPISKGYRFSSFKYINRDCDISTLTTGRLSSSDCGKYGIQMRLYGNQVFNPRYMGINLYSSVYRGTIEFRYFENYDFDRSLTFYNLCKNIILYAISHTFNEIEDFGNKCLDILHHMLYGNTESDLYISYVINTIIKADSDKYLIRKMISEIGNKYVGTKAKNLFLLLETFLQSNTELITYMENISHDESIPVFHKNVIKLVLSRSILFERFIQYVMRSTNYNLLAEQHQSETTVQGKIIEALNVLYMSSTKNKANNKKKTFNLSMKGHFSSREESMIRRAGK